ncbi:MAG: S-adenosylmethionine decarboxylase [Candidatus Hodarchaeota archaeon]
MSLQKRYHLLIDVSDCQSDLLSNPERVSEFIRQLAQLSSMQVIFGPEIIEGSPENPGLTGLAVIDYSHIAVHTFPFSGDLFIDLFSCKPFPVTQIMNFIKETFILDDAQITMQAINLNARNAHSLS